VTFLSLLFPPPNMKIPLLLYFLSGMIFILKESFLKKFKFVLLYRAFK
jgi:hypothetical protein